MLEPELVARGAHTMTVCNACRYCEQYCPVFPAMELRRTFDKGDLAYLANLCHNCGECLYACQFAPPHEFAINVPRTFAAIRHRSYEDYCWPRALGVAFQRSGITTALALVAGFLVVMVVAAFVADPGALAGDTAPADFYAVVPHGTMVGLFGGAFAFVVGALGIGIWRFWRDVGTRPQGIGSEVPRGASVHALRDILTLRNLHASGDDCTSAEEVRTPWRRWFHHCTFYGFMLCFASTTVAAIYHAFFGWEAPYAYTSAPVLLGTIGGVGLLVGPGGLLVLRTRRDPALGERERGGMDEWFLFLLFLTSITGLALLLVREERDMPAMLIAHLAVVLALFVTLPYGKFVHGLYRAAALVKAAREGVLHRD